MEDVIKKAGILIEALPYIKGFRNKIFVFKYGGSILGEESIREGVLEDIAFLSLVGIKVVLVHGGGPNISERMKKEGIKTEFVEGMRITDAKTLGIVGEELISLNKMITKELKTHSVSVESLLGDKDKIIEVKKKRSAKDLGFVGDVAAINSEAINKSLKKGSIVVVSPMGVDKNKTSFNVNADEAAAAVAGGLLSEKFVLLTNVKGVMRNPEDELSLISTISEDKIKSLIKQKIIQEGMIPKVKACIKSLDSGVKKTHIIDARISHAILLEIFTDEGIGTEIIK